MIDNPDQATDNQDQSQATEENETVEPKQWYDSLNTDFQNHPSIKKFNDPNGLAKSYLELEKTLGQDKVVLPKDENDTEGWSQFYNKIGVPAEASEYEFEDFEGLPDDLKETAFDADSFKAIAKDANLTKSQAKKLQGAYMKHFVEAFNVNQEKQAKAINEAKNQLTREFGLAYNDKINLAKSVIQKFSGDKGSFDYLNQKIGNDPKAIKFLVKVGEQFSEGSLGDFKPQGSFTKTPAQAKTEYDDIMSDSNDPYWKGVPSRVKYVTSLLEMMHGGQA